MHSDGEWQMDFLAVLQGPNYQSSRSIRHEKELDPIIEG